MEFTSRPLHDLFGEEISNDVLGLTLDHAHTVVEDVIGRAGLLLVRGASFDDVALAHFAASFGPLESLSPDPSAKLEVGRVTNLDAEDRLFPPGHDMLSHTRANELWHIDGTYRSPGARFSFLHARVVTQGGGQTEFCDGRAAWDRLPDARKASLRELEVGHSIVHSRELIGFDMGDVGRSRFPPVVRRLVRRHGPSGRDALLLASHIENVEGMGYAEGRALIDELTVAATAPDQVYRHDWRVGDLLMWDNRCIIHRATPYPYHDQARDMRSCRTIDVNDTGLASLQTA